MLVSIVYWALDEQSVYVAIDGKQRWFPVTYRTSPGERSARGFITVNGAEVQVYS